MGKGENSREGVCEEEQKENYGQVLQLILVKARSFPYTQVSELFHMPQVCWVINLQTFHSQLFEAGGVNKNSLFFLIRLYLGELFPHHLDPPSRQGS